MKLLHKSLLTALAMLASAPMASHADALSAYWGTMDTELLGKGDLVGGSFEFAPFPFVSIQLRGGYADGFEEFNIKAPSNEGLPAEQAFVNDQVFGQLGNAGRLELKDFSVVPLEIGLIGRVSLFGFFGVYAGAGYGYYIIPALEVGDSSGFKFSEDIKDISGYWGLIGVEVGIPSLKAFAEVKYSKIVADNIELELEYAGYKGNLTADIDLSGLTCMIGVRLQW